MDKFSKEQLIFVVDLAMTAGLDRIESAVPDTIPLAEYTERKDEIENYICGCIGVVGMNLACLWAQTQGKEMGGEGMGIGDALTACGFEDLAKQFVEERTKPDWPGLQEGDPCYPSTTEIATKFVEEHWEAYLSPFSDTGLELDDGGVIDYPDTYGGDIRCLDQFGNTRETRHYPGLGADDDQWWDWYDLFAEVDAEFRLFEGLHVRVNDEWSGEIEEIDVDKREARIYSDDKNQTSDFLSWDILSPLRPQN